MKDTKLTISPILSWCMAKLLWMPLVLAILLAFTLSGMLPDASTAAAEPLQIGQWCIPPGPHSRGAPQEITALAQADDGGLWIGSLAGLYHFNGLTFTELSSPAGEPAFPTDRVMSLLVTTDGTIWVGLSSEDLVRIKEGHVKVFRRVETETMVGVEQIVQGPEAKIWALSRRRVIRLGEDGEWHWEGQYLGLPQGQVMRLMFDDQGILWAAQPPYLYELRAGAHVFARTEIRVGAEQDLVQVSSRRIWLCALTGKTLHGRLTEFHFDGTGEHRLAVNVSSSGRNLMLPQPDGSVWIARDGQGLLRLDPGRKDRRRYSDRARELDSPLEAFDDRQGLSSNSTAALIRDQQGNIWPGGTRGLDRFQQPRLIHIPLPTASAETVMMQKDSSGDIWIALPGVGLYSVRGTSLHLKVSKRDYLGLSPGVDNAVLFHDDAGLWRFTAGKLAFIRAFFPAGPAYFVSWIAQTDNLAFASIVNPTKQS